MEAIVLFSVYGTAIINGEFCVYSRNEKIVNWRGEEVDPDDADAKYFVADVVIETDKKRYVFPQVNIGYEFAAKIGYYLLENADKSVVTIDLHTFHDQNLSFDMIGENCIKTEYLGGDSK